jgi:hypothetical protein
MQTIACDPGRDNTDGSESAEQHDGQEYVVVDVDAP